MKVSLFLAAMLLILSLSSPVYAQNWAQVNTDGFGDINNYATGRIAVYKDQLYVGTLEESTGTEIWRFAPGAMPWMMLLLEE